ncbi:MAG: hypothetical protein WC872_01620 [Candidatus Absconditabacterales bacterium]|jgi:hypothetical protein
MKEEEYKFKSDLCHCDCHTNDSMKHCVPCCYECPNCHENIITIKFFNHVEDCTGNYRMVTCENCGKEVKLRHYFEHIKECKRENC